jgi:ADP-heptose:LPS heptosyltransferase
MRILIAPYARKMRNEKENPKNYPWWPELVSLLKEHEMVQIGVDGEKQLVQDFRKNLPLSELQILIKECDFWISADSFLQHMAQHFNKKGVVIWSLSDPNIFGYPNNINILKDRKYLRKSQFEIWEKEEYNTHAFVRPEEIFKVITSTFK